MNATRLAVLILLLFVGTLALSGEIDNGPEVVDPAETSSIPGSESTEEFRGLDGTRLPLGETPLAVTVITGDELRALGVHKLPEALRYVAGVDVFQLNGFTYAAGIRGVDDEFNSRFHVYLDGRLVNIAEFGGVDWESIPISVDDIERIEIIRAVGLGGESGMSLQGAIRIWSKTAANSPLVTYSGYVGDEGRNSYFGRVAHQFGAFSAKISLEYITDDGLTGLQPSGLIPGRFLDDGQNLFKLNTAFGWKISESTDLNLRVGGVFGEVDESSGDPVSNGSTDTNNYSISARLTKELPGGTRLAFGYSYEDFRLRVVNYPGAALYGTDSDIELHRYTNTLFASSRVPLLPIWDLIGSAGWKEDQLFFERNVPRSDDEEIYHLNLGTEVRPLDPLILSAGLHLERDLFTDLDLSPSAGVVWRVLDDHSLRASYRVGRRKPNFTEREIAFVVPNPVPPPATLPLVTGNPNLNRETVKGFEGGYHGRFEELGLDLDAQLYVHELVDKIVFFPDLTSPVPGAITFANASKERAWGSEITGIWKIWGPISAFANYTLQIVEETRSDLVVRSRPRHKANGGLRVHFEDGLLEGLSAFLNLNFVSQISQFDALGVPQAIGDRYRVDFRIAKSFFDDNVEIAFVGRNVFDSETLEFQPALGSNYSGAFGANREFFFNLLIRWP